VLADQQQNVDHLPRGLRRAVAIGERLPELVKAGRPGAAVALLGKRQRARKPGGLARKRLELVIQPRARAEAAVQPLMGRDLLAAVADRDSARADRRGDAQTGQRDRDAVAVLADRDKRL